MNISIKKTKAQLSELIDLILNKEVETITITKHNKPVAQLVPLCSKKLKRIGAAKKEMENFDLDLNDFNSIRVEVFGE